MSSADPTGVATVPAANTPAAAAGCSPLDLVCQAKEGAANAISAGATDALAILATSVNEALGAALASLGSAWVAVRTPNLTGTGAGAETVTFLQDSLWFYMAGFAVLAVIVGGARMAWEHRGEPAMELLRALGTLVVVSAAGVTGIGLALTAADGFAAWVLERSTTGTNLGTNLVGLLGTAGLTGGPVIAIVLGVCALLASCAQIMLMIARAGMLVILAGILPLTAAFTSTETGRTWFRRALGWTAAFVLYKPAAAVVYATAFRLTGADTFGDDGLVNALVGLVLMVLALFALPALLRFVTPLVAATAGSGGGGALGATALAALPTGAIALAGGRGPSGASSSSSPASGSSGPAAPGGPGGSGTPGSPGGPGPSGGAGVAGAGTAGGASAAGAAGTAGTAGAAAASGGAAAGGATAGAAGGPAGMAAGAAAGAAVQTAQGAVSAVKGAAESATDPSNPEGPRGSR